jgi:hypothetical protein
VRLPAMLFLRLGECLPVASSGASLHRLMHET